MSKAQLLKELVHPKMNVLSSFTNPHVVPNAYDFLQNANCFYIKKVNGDWIYKPKNKFLKSDSDYYIQSFPRP